jgi:hypothetical protein
VTGLATLTQLCPPPPNPRPGPDWAGVEAQLGTRLPGDCKQHADTYGPGSFAYRPSKRSAPKVCSLGLPS